MLLGCGGQAAAHPGSGPLRVPAAGLWEAQPPKAGADSQSPWDVPGGWRGHGPRGLCGSWGAVYVACMGLSVPPVRRGECGGPKVLKLYLLYPNLHTATRKLILKRHFGCRSPDKHPFVALHCLQYEVGCPYHHDPFMCGSYPICRVLYLATLKQCHRAGQWTSHSSLNVPGPFSCLFAFLRAVP